MDYSLNLTNLGLFYYYYCFSLLFWHEMRFGCVQKKMFQSVFQYTFLRLKRLAHLSGAVLIVKLANAESFLNPSHLQLISFLAVI